MTTTDWGALFAQFVADYHDDTPLAPQGTFSDAGVLAALTAAVPYAKDLQAAIHAHPGAVRALDDFLDFLKARGCAWAGDLRAAVDATPGALDLFVSMEPRLVSLLNALKPAAIGIPGGWSGARGHV